MKHNKKENAVRYMEKGKIENQVDMSKIREIAERLKDSGFVNACCNCKCQVDETTIS